MGQYVTVQDVLDFLYIMFEAGDPSTLVAKFQNWIEARILECEEIMRERCRTSWHVQTTSEFLKRSNAWQFAESRMRHVIIPSYQPLRAVVSLEVDFGNGFVPQQQNVDFIVRDNEILLTRKLYRAWVSFNAIKLTYQYGFDSAPTDVKGAIIRMVAKELLTTAALQPFLQKQPTKDTIEALDIFIEEVVARHSRPQLIPR